MNVPNIGGYESDCPPALLALYVAASARYRVPLSILLIQGSQESGFDPSIISWDGGYGVSQWTYEPVARQYLGVPTGDWHAAALALAPLHARSDENDPTVP